MMGRIEPFYKEASDPVGEMESINTGCVQSAVTGGLHGDADERYLDESCQRGFLEEVTHKQTQDRVTRQNSEGCSGQ